MNRSGRLGGFDHNTRGGQTIRVAVDADSRVSVESIIRDARREALVCAKLFCLASIRIALVTDEFLSARSWRGISFHVV